MDVIDLGLVDYGEALKKQQQLVEDMASGQTSQESLVICEHPTVITVGRGIGSKEEIFTKDIPIFEISRGGRSTLHAPGQIVAYPILDLKKRGGDLHNLLRVLEESIIETLDAFQINADRFEGRTGVWVADRKIASIGIAVKQSISYHGLALNVINDLSLFQQLNPCGFTSNVMTSVEKELPDYSEYKGHSHGELLNSVRNTLLTNLKQLLEAMA